MSNIKIQMEKEYLDDLRIILNSDLSRLILCHELMKETYEVLKTITSEVGYQYMNTVFDKDCIDIGKCYRYYTGNNKKLFTLALYNENHEKLMIKFDTTNGKVVNQDNTIHTNVRNLNYIREISEIYCYGVNYTISIEDVANRIENSLGDGWSRIRRLNEILSEVNKNLDTMYIIDSLTKGNNFYNNV